MLRLLHNPRAAWWFRLLAHVAAVHVASCFALIIIASIIQAIRYGSDEAELANHELDPPFALTIPVAAVAAIYYYRRLGDPQAALKPRKEWRSEANSAGFMTALGVLWICLVLVATVTSAIDWLSFLPDWSSGVFQLVAWLLFVLPFARWAYIARRNLELELLEQAQPPELRVVVNLTKLSEGFRERAQALEDAMREATVISEQIQSGIELGQQQFNELQEQYLRQYRLNELSPEQTAAVADLLARQQAISEKRARKSNIRIAFVFYVLGVVTPLLIPTTLVEQIRQLLYIN
jgi:hypothetical protein